MEGGSGTSYTSAILMRHSDGEGGWAAPGGMAPPHGTRDVRAPADGSPLVPVGPMRGKRLAFNVLDSMSGLIALSRDLESLGANIGIFGARIMTGSHRASIVAVAEARADICAVDCRSWDIARRHEPAAAAVRVVGWTGMRKGLPMIASRHLAPAVLKELRAVLST